MCHKQIQLIAFILLLLIYKSGIAQSMSVGGNNWSVSPPAITEAGKNYVGIYESPDNQILLTLTGPLLLGNMHVSAHYEANPLWDNNLKLSILRTNSGTGLCLLCSLSGNENYIQLNTTDITLFNFTTAALLTTVNNVAMKLKVSGVSVVLPAATYGCKVVFTISPN